MSKPQQEDYSTLRRFLWARHLRRRRTSGSLLTTFLLAALIGGLTGSAVAFVVLVTGSLACTSSPGTGAASAGPSAILLRRMLVHQYRAMSDGQRGPIRTTVAEAQRDAERMGVPSIQRDSSIQVRSVDPETGNAGGWANLSEQGSS